jgi:transcription initiation factor IIE alpha subunit
MNLFSFLRSLLRAWRKTHTTHDLVDMPSKERPNNTYTCACGATFVDGGKAMEHISQSQNPIRGNL